MNNEQSLAEAITMAPLWVQYWLIWMQVAIIGSFLVLLFYRGTRKDALFIFLSTVAAIIIVEILYAQLGYVRLLGLAHIFWIPLVIYFTGRLHRTDMPVPARVAMAVFTLTATLSLVFDVSDVIRYALGERAIMFAI